MPLTLSPLAQGVTSQDNELGPRATLRKEQAPNTGECCALCDSEPECVFFTYCLQKPNTIPAKPVTPVIPAKPVSPSGSIAIIAAGYSMGAAEYNVTKV